MTPIRPAILRHYYESVFDGQEAERYADATFDELVALLRITDPSITAWSAADSAPSLGRPDLAKLAKKLTPDPIPDTRSELGKLAAEFPHLSILRERAVDLRVKLKGSKAQVLECQKVAISGWAGLAAPEPWLHIELRVCTSADASPLSPPQPVERLRVIECDSTCLEAVLRSTSATSVEIIHLEPLDLHLLASHAKLERLIAYAPLVHGIHHLKGAKLRELWLKEVAWSDELTSAITALGPTLETLKILSDDPFLPSALPLPKKLGALTVRAHPELRQEWTDFAVAHPKIRVDFARPDRDPRRKKYAAAPPAKSAAPAPRTKGPAAGSAKGARPASRALPPSAKKADAPVTLSSLRKKARFASWEGHRRPDLIKASRAILRDAVESLAELGADATKARQRAVLKKAVQRFNQLDEKERFITTIEAEDITAELDEIMLATKLAGESDLVDEWREF